MTSLIVGMSTNTKGLQIREQSHRAITMTTNFYTNHIPLSIALKFNGLVKLIRAHGYEFEWGNREHLGTELIPIRRCMSECGWAAA